MQKNLKKRMMIVSGACLAAAGTLFGGADAEAVKTAGLVCRTDRLAGFERTQFVFEGCEAWVVEPAKAAADGRWVWCMEWPTAFQDRTGVKALLEAGYRWVTFNPAYIGTFDPEKRKMTAGNQTDEMVAKRSRFQKFLVEKLGLSAKCGLIGMSWGGFYSVRYASIHPEAVKAIYLDAPLLDFSSLGSYRGASAEKGGEWRRIQAYYPFATRDYVGADDPFQSVSPERAKTIAKAGIPMMVLYGGRDTVVPPAKNIERFAPVFERAGGDLRTEKRGTFGHHPHGVEPNEVSRIVNFFDRAFDPPKKDVK